MNFTIRPLQPEDYPAATRIYNAQNEPHHHLTEDELRRSDERAKEKRFYRLLSAVRGDEVIATGQVGERRDDPEPGKYWAWFFVREDFRGEGVDSAMFDAACDLLAGHPAKSLWTCIREDFIPASAYLREREYEEQFRSWGANLELARFDPSRYAGYAAALEQDGIGLRTFDELADDPRRHEKLTALQDELEEDAPHHEPIIPKRHIRPDDPDMLTDSLVIAVKGDEYLGMAGLSRPGRFSTVPGCALTGVQRAYRNRGIATALKAFTATWAKAHGYTEVNCGGAGENQPMLKVNRRLGFDVEPAWITYARFL